VRTRSGWPQTPRLQTDRLTLNINAASIPLDPANGAIQAIHDAFRTWDQAAKIGMTVHDSGGAGGPAEDGNSSIGWVRIVPPKTLAATWVWTTTVNGVEYVTEADVCFNLSQPWGVFSVCNALDVFEVGNVIFHEAGHVFGLDHVSDPGAPATMYPSAPRGEVRKRTLTTRDVEGAASAAESAHLADKAA
jgi:Matrixin